MLPPLKGASPHVASNKQPQYCCRPRLVLGVKVAMLLCELCGLFIALLKVLSDRGRGAEVAFILLSAACTLGSFSINCIGFSRVLTAARRAAARISARVTPASPAPRQPTHLQPVVVSIKRMPPLDTAGTEHDEAVPQDSANGHQHAPTQAT